MYSNLLWTSIKIYQPIFVQFYCIRHNSGVIFYSQSSPILKYMQKPMYYQRAPTRLSTEEKGLGWDVLVLKVISFKLCKHFLYYCTAMSWISLEKFYCCIFWLELLINYFAKNIHQGLQYTVQAGEWPPEYFARKQLQISEWQQPNGWCWDHLWTAKILSKAYYLSM